MRLVAIVEGGELDGERLVALAQSDALGVRDALGDVSRTCLGLLVGNGQLGEMQTTFVNVHTLFARHTNKTLFRTEIQHAIVAFDGRVPIELGGNKTVLLMEIREHLGLGIEVGKTVHGGDPQHAVLPLHDALHGVVSQAVLHVVGLERLLASLVHLALVKSIAVAAYPERTIRGLAETGYLVDDATLRGVELVFQMSETERRLSRRAMQIDHHSTLQTPHPQVAVLRDDAAYAPSEVAAALEGVHHLARLEIIEVNTVVAAYP